MNRYPFAPVDALRGDTEISVLADKLGVAHGTVQRWRERGLTETNADRIATALGLHPWQLWPEMQAVATAQVMRECAHPDCAIEFVLTRSDRRFCSDRCRNSTPEKRARRSAVNAARQRARYRADAEVRAAKIARVRAYRDSARAAINAKQRAYYRANADRLRAEQRARRQRQKDAA